MKKSDVKAMLISNGKYIRKVRQQALCCPAKLFLQNLLENLKGQQFVLGKNLCGVVLEYLSPHLLPCLLLHLSLLPLTEIYRENTYV
ncbi:MAG: hypothetical protein LBQ31_03625 [Bacteroidales bacterium]|jgi:hypothetical protein|nr:hypothetical protein [Bacteroidales bacterium]